MLNKIIGWAMENYQWVIGILVQALIAYHVYFLSRKITNKNRLEHKQSIKQKAEKLICDIRSKKINSEVYLINMGRYFKDYPSNKEKRFRGYSHIKAEIKTTRFNGIEFFEEMPKDVYIKRGGKLSFKGNRSEKSFIVYPVGIVPYEWVEYIELDGDEFSGVPLFFCHFRGRTNWKFWKRLLFFGYPYKQIVYYKIWGNYKEGYYPADMEFEPIIQKIYDD